MKFAVCHWIILCGVFCGVVPVGFSRSLVVSRASTDLRQATVISLSVHNSEQTGPVCATDWNDRGTAKIQGQHWKCFAVGGGAGAERDSQILMPIENNVHVGIV